MEGCRGVVVNLNYIHLGEGWGLEIGSSHTRAGYLRREDWVKHGY